MIDHCIDMDDGDSPQVFTSKMIKARKTHQCYECGNPVKPGEMYELVKGLWDGSWSTYKTCRICKSVRDDFFQSYIFGMLWEMMRETYGLGYDEIVDEEGDTWWDQDDQARADMLLRKPSERSGHRSSIPEISRRLP